jgi:hypothetical protein
MLANARSHVDGQRKRGKGVGSAIRRSAECVPLPTRVSAIGLLRDRHGGTRWSPKTDGDLVHTLTLTGLAIGWTECVAMRLRDQMLVIGWLEKAAADLPFAMLGLDS